MALHGYWAKFKQMAIGIPMFFAVVMAAIYHNETREK